MGHLLKIRCVDSRAKVHILASTSVPFTLTMVQVPNLALTHTKRITVWKDTYNRLYRISLPTKLNKFFNILFWFLGHKILESLSGFSRMDVILCFLGAKYDRIKMS
jgi:hypothetical protein